MVGTGYPEDATGRLEDGSTIVYTGISAVLCKSDSVVLVAEGAPDAVALTCGSPVLLVRGQVFRAGETEVLPWAQVARQLSTLQSLEEMRKYLSSLRGSFWVAYARMESSLCLYTATDLVGIMPMWLGRSTDNSELLASSLWPPSRVPLAGHVAHLRQACPRVLHRFSSDSGLEASAPDGFHGLNALLEPWRSDGSALEALVLQAARRCVAGEGRVGLLFSGGLDSGLLGFLFAAGFLAPCQCTCYTVGFHLEDKKGKSQYAYPEDLRVAEAAATGPMSGSL